MTPNLETVARSLTKASRRAIVKIEPGVWTEEGHSRPARSDAYSLWWGRDGKRRLVESPEPFDFNGSSCRWRWKLTPLGLALRQHLLAQEKEA